MYKRIVIKLSGGALAGSTGFGFDPDSVNHIVDEVLALKDLGVEVAIVVGGGNILRGSVGTTWGIERAEADAVGMLGTVINGLILKAAFQARDQGGEYRVMTAVRIDEFCEPYLRLRAQSHLRKGYTVIFAGGIGQPYVTTDYPSVQRAIEINADLLLVAKQGVDGVYDSDPRKNPEARQYRTLAYQDFVSKDLKIMDSSALLLARDHKLPVCIFNFKNKDAIRRVVEGQAVGTLVTPTTALSFV